MGLPKSIPTVMSITDSISNVSKILSFIKY